MKKAIRTILCAAAFAVLAVSCQKGIDKVEPVEDNKGLLGNTDKGTIDIKISGLMGEYNQIDATKSELVSTVRVSWDAGDIVYVYDGTQCLGSLIASLDGDGDRYAILSTNNDHTVTAPAAGTKLTLVHSPLLKDAPAVNEGALSISLADQNSEKAPFVAYATLDYNNEKSITNVIVPFKFATSVIKVNCTGLKAGTAIDNAKLSNVNTACKLSLSGTEAPTVIGDVNGIITRTGDAYFAEDKVNSEGEAVFQIAVPVLTAGNRSLTIVQGPKMFDDTNFSQSALNAATSVNTVCQLIFSTLSGKFSVAEDKQVYFAKGNLWADATDPENPVFSFEASQCDVQNTWNTSHVTHFYWSKSAEEAVKAEYNRDQERSGLDVFFTNQEDDTANPAFTVGGVCGKFRAISKGDWEYLFANHSHKWVTINEIGGYVIAPYGVTLSAEKATYTEDDLNNGNLVFIPAAGSRYGINISYAGKLGYYWSSSALDEGGHEASYLYFHSDRISPDLSSGRDLGYPVRLVRDAI